MMDKEGGEGNAEETEMDRNKRENLYLEPIQISSPVTTWCYCNTEFGLEFHLSKTWKLSMIQ